jgi:hypothetical protein
MTYTRYEVRYTQYEENGGWDRALVGKARSYFIYDPTTKTIVAKFPCRDCVDYRGDTIHNDPMMQKVRADKLCEFMNKLEGEYINNMHNEEIV